MTALLLLVIVYSDGQNDQSLNLLQCSQRSLGRDNQNGIPVHTDPWLFYALCLNCTCTTDIINACTLYLICDGIEDSVPLEMAMKLV